MKLLATKSRASRGDTIVEVIIVLAILGLAFALSYSTANKSLILARNAEEHSEALQFLNSQIEQIRSYASVNSAANLQTYTTAGHAFCFDASGAKQDTTDILSDPGHANAACYLGSETVSGHPLYGVSTIYTPGSATDPAYFTATISWPGLGQLSTQKEQLNYRIY